MLNLMSNIFDNGQPDDDLFTFEEMNCPLFVRSYFV